MLLPCLFIAPSAKHGRGVYTNEFLEVGTTIEISPVIVLPTTDRLLLDKTLLHDYIFEWGEDRLQSAVGLGYLSVYNHACPSNCIYEMDFDAALMRITTVAAIQKGEELFINYHGDFNNLSPLWFTVDTK
ncbi:MAG: SET domain-containing protein [Bacteroidetes bacterium]|nr:SET domain-containing protein [Bacteroidota bacterium]